MVKITPAVAEMRLNDVSQDKRFWCRDGKYLKNIQELQEALEGMSDDIFRYHVNDAKNDFSTWVIDIFGDDKLANDLRKSTSAAAAARNVANRISFLKSKLS